VKLPPTNLKDGAEVVFIPAGVFLMGSKDGNGKADEQPQHTVYLDSYYIYKYDVTVAEYRTFCQATGRAMPDAPSWGWLENHPMVDVSWNDAKAYADWAGAALPSEAQWEKAARGTDGRLYPWGNDWDAAKCNTGSKQTSSVGSFPAGASPYGCLDMAGNVWQWCADWYGEDYYKNSPTNNPTGPATGEVRVLRGGSWYYYDFGDYKSGARGAVRDGIGPDGWYYYIGFRCAVLSPVP
jgi:formylglycine-generating enzyme required for sulfatase activity